MSKTNAELTAEVKSLKGELTKAHNVIDHDGATQKRLYDRIAELGDAIAKYEDFCTQYDNALWDIVILSNHFKNLDEDLDPVDAHAVLRAIGSIAILTSDNIQKKIGDK